MLLLHQFHSALMLPRLIIGFSSWKLLFPLLLLFSMAGPCPASSQTLLHVNGSAPAGGDGSSWETAIADLVVALDTAAQISGPVEIWVVRGVYIPDSGQDGDIASSFDLSGDLRLLGGFFGDETSAQERDPAANTTTLSGNIGWGNYSLNIVKAIDLSAPSLIDGFRFIKGNADFDGGDLLGGGALFIQRGDLEIRQCHFTLNSAGSSTPSLGNFGGSVYVKETGAVTIENCRFDYNFANAGGCVGAFGDDGVIDLVIRDSVFSNNYVPTQAGGALFISIVRSLIIEGCEFNDNFAGYGGAIYCDKAKRVVIRDCNFERNEVESEVAALLLKRSDNFQTTPAIVERCRFIDNRKTGGSSAGGTVHLEQTATVMSHCELRGNYNLYFHEITGIGGAGVVTAKVGNGYRFINCLVADNFSGLAAGVILIGVQAEFVNCTIVGNRAGSLYQYACGIDATASTFSVDNSIIWGNRFNTGRYDDQPGEGGEHIQLRVNSSNLTINNSTVEGWSGTFGGVGNLGRDPLFLDEEGYDLHLQSSSPAIDAGNNGSVPADLMLDLEGNLRILDGNGDDTAVVDMGAYESETNVSNVGPGHEIGARGLRLAISRHGGGLSIDFRLPRDANVDLAVFDIRGRRLRVLAQGSLPLGEHNVGWDEKDAGGRRVASGVYIVHLAADGQARSRRVVLAR